jgi:YggT family protein
MSNTVAFWAFQIPNLLLAAAMYTLIGRFVLSLFFGPDNQMVIWKVFQQITDPVLKAVRVVTPQLVPNGLVMILTVVWLFWLRIGLYVVFVLFGISPAG